MSREVFWSDDALADLLSIFEHIAQDNVRNAHLVADRIEHTVNLLSDMAFGRAGRMKNTFEAVVPNSPFIVAYQLTGETSLSIVRVIHGARDWKEGEWPE
jgi:toxin ParE1/3/4